MSNQSPRQETAGGFSSIPAAPEQDVLAQKQQLLVRYYLWAADGPWRLFNQLHQDLMDRKVALPQFAGTKQKVLEVFARRIGVETYSLRGQGTCASPLTDVGSPRSDPIAVHARSITFGS